MASEWVDWDLEKVDASKELEKKNIASSSGPTQLTITSSSPYYIGSLDNPGTQLVAVPLKGENYRNQACSMRTVLRAKTKLGFIDGSIRKRAANSPEFLIWEKLWRTFFMMQHDSHISVTDFDTSFKSLLDELNELQPLPQCNCGASKELAQREQDQYVNLFLGSLDNDRFGHVKGTILNTYPLPSLRRVINLREEAHFVAEKEREPKLESEAAFRVNKGRNQDGPRLKCEHRGKIGHKKAKYYELIGYPLSNTLEHKKVKLQSI
ncbi:Gag-polypeptide of LTR copia-type [Sesbania bispinosa]|nr:Gag-polypeptide of LTR copia-type [Sesbania bispinosa]